MDTNSASKEGYGTSLGASSTSEATSKASGTFGLWSFTPDILSQILAYKCVSHKVVDLWNCGSRSLQSALTRSVTIVELSNGKEFVQMGLPFCLSFLRSLRFLSIDRRSHQTSQYPQLLTKRHSVVHVLKNLSTTLEELHLNFADSSSLCIPFCEPSVTSLFESTDAISPTQVADPFEHSVDLASSYPNLKTLILDTRGENDPRDIQYLPRCLTSLSVGLNTQYPHIKEFGAALPPSLTFFYPFFWKEINDSSFFDSLPSSITEIDFSYSNSTEDTLGFAYKANLPNLTKVEMGYDAFLEPSSFLASLPPLLSYLPVGCTDIDPTKWLEKIPASVTHMGCDKKSFSPFASRHLPLFPPAISTIGWNITLDDLKSGELPASLTSLRGVSIAPQIGAQFVSFLPPFLVSLRLELLSATLSADFFRALPHTLGSFRLLCDVIEEIPSLPPRLGTLKIKTEQPITGAIHPLPESITQLSWNVAESPFTHLLFFPRRLKTLKLETFTYPASFDPSDPLLVARAQDLNEVGRKDGFLIDTETHILQPSSEKIEVGVLDLLPRTLTYLRFGRYVEVSMVEVSEWRRLPKKLKNLEVLGDLVSADAISAMLPLQYLTSMELGPCTLLSEHLAMLPDCFQNIDLLGEDVVTFDFEPELMNLAPPDVRVLDWYTSPAHEAVARTRKKHLLEALHSLNPIALKQALLPRTSY